MSDEEKLFKEFRAMRAWLDHRPELAIEGEAADEETATNGFAPVRPEVYLGPETVLADELGKVMSEKDFFMWMDNLVTVRDGRPRLVDVLGFPIDVARQVLFVVDTREKGRREKALAADKAKRLLHSETLRDRLPVISGFAGVRQPVIRASGAMELLPAGYDAATGTYTADELEIMEQLPLETGVRRLMDLLEGFPWDGPTGDLSGNRSVAAQVAAMLAPFVTPLLPLMALRPAFFWEANSCKGSGKTLLAKLAAVVSTGNLDMVAYARGEYGKKEVDAAMGSGAPVLLFDNLKGRVDWSYLEMLMTNPANRTRLLGGHEWVDLPTVWFFLTGNDFRMSADIARRGIVIRLFAQRERLLEAYAKRENEITDSRLFTPKFRSHVISALWSLVRHWDAIGRPDGDGLLLGYEDASKLLGGIVTAAGFADPFAILGEADGEVSLDRERVDFEEMVRLVAVEAEAAEAVRTVYRFSDLVEFCRDNELFLEVIGQTHEEGQELRAWRGAFARLLYENVGQVVSITTEEVECARWRFTTEKRTRHGRTYLFEKIC